MSTELNLLLAKNFKGEVKMVAKVIVKVLNGGKFSNNEEYVAIVQPKLTKKGKVVSTGFKVIDRLKVIKNGYKYRTAKSVEIIIKILEIIENKE